MRRRHWLAMLVFWILALLIAHRCLTFPVFGYHAPSCLCGACLDAYEADRPFPAQEEEAPRAGR